MTKLTKFPSINCITSKHSEINQKILKEKCEDYNLQLNFYYSCEGLGSDLKVTIDYSSYMNNLQLTRVLSHLKCIRDWYENSNEPYAFFCEDNIILETNEKWAFTWAEFMNKLPDDWGVIQLSLIRNFENQFIDSYMKFNSYVWDNWSASSYIMTREYAKSLIDLHIKTESLYDLTIPSNPNIIPYIENVLYNSNVESKVYTIPLFMEDVNRIFSENLNLISQDEINQRRKCSIFFNTWWKQNGNFKSLRWFFNEKTTEFDPSCFHINPKYQESKRIFIVDNFYENPDAVREFALQQEYFNDPGYVGRRTRQQFLFPGLKESFEEIMNHKITKWEEHGMNGRFQHNWSGESLVYHCDDQTWAGVIYLTPDAPPECGTTTWRHKKTKIHHNSQINWASGQGMQVFNGRTFVDKTPYEPVDVCGNVYNRLVIFSGGCIHSASEYFGDCLENCRLWHMFFFD